ncbi:MAG: site-specific integrase [Desulfovibrionales bacterium]|nr:site-specific integrase [Desulfovibrionales bacterium]
MNYRNPRNSSRRTSYIHQRSNSQILYYRIVIPSDLRNFFKTVEFRRSLHTAYRREAQQMALHVTAQFHHIFRLLRKCKEGDMGAFRDLFEKIEIAKLEFAVAAYNSGKDSSPLLDEITQWSPSVEDMNNLMNYIFTEELKTLSELPILGLKEPEGEVRYKQQLNKVINNTQKSIKEKAYKDIGAILITEFLIEHGVVPGLTEEEIQKIGLGGGRALINYAKAQLARLDGDYDFEKEHLSYDIEKLPEAFRGKAKYEQKETLSDTPLSNNISTYSTTAPAEENLKAKCPKLSEAFEGYIQHSQLRGKYSNVSSKDSAKSKLRLFITYFGDLKLSDITRDDANNYLKVMQATPSKWYTAKKFKHRPIHDIVEEFQKKIENNETIADDILMKPTTMNNHINMLKSICDWAIDEGFITKNPFHNLTTQDKRNKRTLRHPFSTTHLREIFFSDRYRTDDFLHPYAFWTPIIALYSGMRSGEISQLRKSDIKCVDNVWCFHVTTEEPNPPKDENYRKSLKAGTKERMVPIHPFLLNNLNFLSFVKSVPPTKYNVLFTGIPPVGGKWGKYTSKSFNDFANEVLGFDSKYRFHSFRHTFKDFYRQGEIYNPVCAAFIGHSNKNETEVERRYGSDYLPSIMKKYLYQLEYDIDLSHLANSKFVIK